jgi:hypothetical protein
VIAAIACRAGAQAHLDVSILSSDLDLWQLLGPGGGGGGGGGQGQPGQGGSAAAAAGHTIELLLPGGPKGGLERVTSDTVKKRLGVEPRQVRGGGRGCRTTSRSGMVMG